jgi:hypothetical protein
LGRNAASQTIPRFGIGIIGLTCVNPLQRWSRIGATTESLLAFRLVGKAQGAGDHLMLDDPDAAFAHAAGMAVDASGFGLGLRSKQYAIVFQDEVVEEFLPEENGFSIESSTAARGLAKL